VFAPFPSQSIVITVQTMIKILVTTVATLSWETDLPTPAIDW